MKSKAPFSEAQVRAIEITCRAASACSVIGCLFVFTTFVCSPKFRRPVNRIIFYAIWGNFLYNIATLISISGINAGLESPLCQFQGFLIQWGGLIDILWNLSLATNVYLTVYKRYSSEQLRRFEVFYIIFNYGITFAIALSLVFVKTQERGRVYGSAAYWCWISTEWDYLRIVVMYAPVWFSILGIFTMYSLAGFSIYKKQKELQEFEYVISSKSTRASARLPQEPMKTTEVNVVFEKSKLRRDSQSPSDDGTLADPEQQVGTTALPGVKGKAFEPYSFSVATGPSSTYPLKPVSSMMSEAAVDDSNARAVAAQQNAYNRAAKAYTKKAALFFCALLITWIATSINRLYSFVHPDRVSFGLSYASILLVPLMGFWNTVTYCLCSIEALRSLGEDIKSFFLRRRSTGQQHF